MFSQCLSDGSVVRALSVARVSVASQIVATFLLDHGHARLILCWLCAVLLFVCFVACVCTACAPMFAILFRCCDPWLPRGRGAVILHAGVALSQGTFRFAFRAALIAFMHGTQFVCSPAVPRESR